MTNIRMINERRCARAKLIHRIKTIRTCRVIVLCNFFFAHNVTQLTLIDMIFIFIFLKMIQITIRIGCGITIRKKIASIIIFDEIEEVL